MLNEKSALAFEQRQCNQGMSGLVPDFAEGGLRFANPPYVGRLRLAQCRNPFTLTLKSIDGPGVGAVLVART